MIGIILLVGVLTLLYFYALKPFSYWSKKNVKTGKVVPIVGDNLSIILGKESFVEATQKWYTKVPDVRYNGLYQFHIPMLLIKTPELIKQICVKDFDHFMNHRSFMPEGLDVFWSKNLVALNGQNWKVMRSTLSPSFTSSKMKAMFILICEKADHFVQHFLKKNEEIHEVELKDAFTRYTNDVIASTAFGIQVDSLGERDNIFYSMGRTATNFNTFAMKVKFFAFQFMPKICTLLNIQLFDREAKIFFTNVVKDTIKMRQEQNIKRPDMLGLLIEAREEQGKNIQEEEEVKEASFAAVEEHLQVENSKRDLSDIGIAAQVFIFFLGGFETVSTAMCFMAYELAVNPDIQKKLMEEIDENRPKTGPPSYETIAKMEYLDMVVSESLRMWPAAIITDRVVTKPYTIQPELPDEHPVHLDINDVIMLPIFAIHHNPQYYPDPEKFIPERFSAENRNTIDPYTYLPFGVGPRNCIGSRFALLEIKAVFFYILSHFEIVPVEKTNIPLKIDKTALNVTSENGFPFGFKRRK